MNIPDNNSRKIVLLISTYKKEITQDSTMGSPTLYQLSVRKVADKFDSFSAIDFRPLLTENMMFDVYWEMLFGGKKLDEIGNILRSDHITSPLEQKRLNILSSELSNLKTFFRFVLTYMWQLLALIEKEFQ